MLISCCLYLRLPGGLYPHCLAAYKKITPDRPGNTAESSSIRALERLSGTGFAIQGLFYKPFAHGPDAQEVKNSCKHRQVGKT